MSLIIDFNDSDFKGFQTVINISDCLNIPDIVTKARTKLVENLKFLNLVALASKAEIKNFYIMGLTFEEINVMGRPVVIYGYNEYIDNIFTPTSNYEYNPWNSLNDYGFNNFTDAIIGPNP